MQWYFIVLIVLGGICLLYCLLDFVVAIFIMRIMMYVPVKTYDEVIEAETGWQKTTKEEVETIGLEDFKFKSDYGYMLQASYLPKNVDVKFKDGKERVMIMVHGWTSNRYSMIIYAKIYRALGFHVFFYDHRNHFQSDRVITTMGNKEADDLECFVKYVRNRMGNNIVLGTQGESMGSATVMMHAGRYHSVDFVCEDCGYSSLKELLHYQCKDLKHLPTFPTLLFGDLVFRVKAKTKYSDVEPAKEVAKCDDIPMYFSHGDSDDFVPSYMVYKCYDAKKGAKKIDVYEGCGHANSVIKHNDLYAKNVHDFLLENNIIDN